MGVVLKAHDEKLQRDICLKILGPQFASSEAVRTRFLREARAAAAIRSEHVVTIYAVEEQRQRPYLVLEYVPGDSLQERIDRIGPLSLHEILRIGLEVAQGLAAAHAQGFVHRDVKPGNILLEDVSGKVKITDFGLARAVDDASLSHDGIVAGTPEYMSPEQARGQPMDHRTDLFSLGSVLYAMCTGHSPFFADGSLAVLKRICEDTPQDLRRLRADLPTELAVLLARLHAKRPDDRPRSAEEVVDALQAIGQSWPPRRFAGTRRRYVALVAAVALTLFLGAGGYLYGLTVYRLATNRGQLVIETDDPDVKVVVKQEEQEVLIIDAKTQHEVTLKAGKYQIELTPTKAGLRLSATEFTLERGGQQIVRVYFEHRAPNSTGPVHILVGHKDYVNAAAFALNGTHVISGGGSMFEDGKWLHGSDFSVRLWDAKTGREVAQLLDHTDLVVCLAVSPDGKFAVSAGQDSVIRLWDLAAEKLVRRFDWRHTGRVSELAFTADGKRVVSAGWDHSVRIWDVETGAETDRCVEGETHAVWGLAVSRDGKQILSSNKIGLLRLWNAETQRLIRSFPTGLNGQIGWISISPEGRYALSAGVIRGATLPVVWNLETGKPAHAFRGHTSWLGGMAFSPDGSRILTSSNDKTVRLWDVATEKELARFEGHENAITTVAFSSDGRFAVSASWDKTVRLWKLPE